MRIDSGGGESAAVDREWACRMSVPRIRIAPVHPKVPLALVPKRHPAPSAALTALRAPPAGWGHPGRSDASRPGEETAGPSDARLTVLHGMTAPSLSSGTRARPDEVPERAKVARGQHLKCEGASRLGIPRHYRCTAATQPLFGGKNALFGGNNG